MQAVEALTRLIAMADLTVSNAGACIDPEDGSGEAENLKQDQLAISICQAMLNTAIPVARFRAHVQIEENAAKVPQGEFTVCAVNMVSIRAGLEVLMRHPLNIMVSVWEQRETGADMISAYQGLTKVQNFRIWVKGLDALETMPPVQ